MLTDLIIRTQNQIFVTYYRLPPNCEGRCFQPMSMSVFVSEISHEPLDYR